MKLVAKQDGLDSDARHRDDVFVVLGRGARDRDTGASLELGELRCRESDSVRVVRVALNVVAHCSR